MSPREVLSTAVGFAMARSLKHNVRAGERLGDFVEGVEGEKRDAGLGAEARERAAADGEDELAGARRGEVEPAVADVDRPVPGVARAQLGDDVRLEVAARGDGQSGGQLDPPATPLEPALAAPA